MYGYSCMCVCLCREMIYHFTSYSRKHKCKKIKARVASMGTNYHNCCANFCGRDSPFLAWSLVISFRQKYVWGWQRKEKQDPHRRLFKWTRTVTQKGCSKCTARHHKDKLSQHPSKAFPVSDLLTYIFLQMFRINQAVNRYSANVPDKDLKKGAKRMIME